MNKINSPAPWNNEEEPSIQALARLNTPMNPREATHADRAYDRLRSAARSKTAKVAMFGALAVGTLWAGNRAVDSIQSDTHPPTEQQREAARKALPDAGIIPAATQEDGQPQQEVIDGPAPQAPVAEQPANQGDGHSSTISQ